MLRPGQMFFEYKIIGFLDRGGQAHIYEASSSEGNPSVALKVLSTKYSKKTSRFEKEIEAHDLLVKKGAKNIMPILDHGMKREPDGRAIGYLAMPRAARNLQDTLSNLAGRLELSLEVFQGIVNGIAGAHTAGIIHRDIKPANILFMDERIADPLVTDFGICFLKSEDQARLTAADETVGARFFMAPEQERGGAIDVTPAADVYSLAKVLHNMLTGRTMYREDLAHAFIPREKANDPRLQLVEDRILSKAIVEEPQARIPNAVELLKIVEQLIRDLRGGPSGPGAQDSKSPDQDSPNSSIPSETRASDGDLGTLYRRDCKEIATANSRLLNLQFDRLTEIFLATWNEIYTTAKNDPTNAISYASRLIRAQPDCTAMFLATARCNARELFPPAKRLLERITRTSEGMSGYPRAYTIPHVQAGFLYMSSCVAAYHFESWDYLFALLTERFEWYYQSGRPLYAVGMEHSYFFHAEALERAASSVHDFVRKEFVEQQITQLLGLSDESFFSVYVQCQLLMSLLAVARFEKGEGREVWPDFGRFNEFRATPLLDRLYSNPSFAQGALQAFSESREDFFKKLNSRLATLQKWLGGSNFSWSSVVNWEPR